MNVNTEKPTHDGNDALSLMERQGRLRRQQSMVKHQEHFDVIVKGSMQHIRDLLEQAAGSTIKDLGEGRDMAMEMLMISFAHELQRRMDRFVHLSIDAGWSKYATAAQESLDTAGLRKLVKDLFESLAQGMPDLVSNSTQPALESLEGWVMHDSTGPMGVPGTGALHAARELKMQADINEAKSKLSNLFVLIMQGLSNSSDSIADEIFSEIDVNRDGLTTKEEFLHGFGEAMGSVLDFSRIVKRIFANRSQLPAGGSKADLSRRGSASALPENMDGSFVCSTVVQSLFIVALLGMAWRMGHSTLGTRRAH